MRPGAARPEEPCREYRETGLARASVQRKRVGFRVPQHACGRAEKYLRRQEAHHGEFARLPLCSWREPIVRRVAKGCADAAINEQQIMMAEFKTTAVTLSFSAVVPNM